MPRQDDPLERLRRDAAGQNDPLARLRADAQAKTPASPSTASPRADFSLLDKIGAGAQVFSDAATFGASGLLDDAVTAALSRGTSFEDLRGVRRQLSESLNPALRTGLQLAGSVATPLPKAGALKALRSGGKLADVVSPANTLLRIAPQSGRGARIAANVAEGAAQAGLEGTVGNVDELSLQGIGSALQRGETAARYGAGFGTAGHLLARPAARLSARVKGLKALDKAAFEVVDEMKRLDEVNYRIARGEATSTQPIREVLESQTVKPFADIVRTKEAYKGLNDAEQLMEVYKLMSSSQRRAAQQIQGTPDFLAQVAADNKSISIAKERMLKAAETSTQAVVPGRATTTYPRRPAPTVREAIDQMQRASGEAARRADPVVSGSPWSEPLPRPVDIGEQMRFADFRRPVMGQPVEVLPGAGAAQPPSPTFQTELRGEPVVRRGEVPAPAGGVPSKTSAPLRGETSSQRGAREALERRSAEIEAARLAPSMELPPQRAITRPSETIDIAAGIPSLRTAIQQHSVKARELDALMKGADIGLSMARGGSLPGRRLTTHSQEAYLRSIPEMTTEEARAALAGVLGRLPEQGRLTSSPLGAFGLITSPVRAQLTAYRTGPIIRALEARIGKGDRGQKAADMTLGLLARAVGALSTNRQDR